MASTAKPRASAAASPRSCPRPSVEDAGELRELPVELIKPNPNQPRTKIDPEALAGLASSIEANGVVQPLLVRPLADGSYELIAGERRWRAAQAGRPREGAGGRPRPGAGRAAAGGADREHGPRGPQPGRRGPCLRRPGRRARPLQGGAGPARRPQPPRRLQPDPPARPARRGARRCSSRASSARATAAPCSAPRATTSAAASPATRPGAAGRCARPRTGLSWPASQSAEAESAADRRRGGGGAARRGRRARGRPRPRGQGAPRGGGEIAVEIRLDDLDEALALARELAKRRG